MTNGNVTLDFALEVFAAGKHPKTPALRYVERIRQLPVAQKPIERIGIDDLRAILAIFDHNYANAIAVMREIRPYLSTEVAQFLDMEMHRWRAEWRAVARAGGQSCAYGAKSILARVEKYTERRNLSANRRRTLKLGAKYLSNHITPQGEVDWQAVARAIQSQHPKGYAYKLLESAIYVAREVLQLPDAPSPSTLMPQDLPRRQSGLSELPENFRSVVQTMSANVGERQKTRLIQAARIAAQSMDAEGRVDWSMVDRLLAHLSPLTCQQIKSTIRAVMARLPEAAQPTAEKTLHSPAQPNSTREAILQALSAPTPARAIFELGKVAPEWTERHFDLLTEFLKALQEVHDDA